MRNVFVIMLLCIIFVISLSIISFQFIDAANHENTEAIIITVKQGDTLWKIASKYNTSGNIRQLIYNIEKMNDIQNCIIYPEQQLTIPVSKIKNEP